MFNQSHYQVHQQVSVSSKNVFLYEWDRPGCRIDFFYWEHLMNEALKTLSGTCKRTRVLWGCLITVYTGFSCLSIYIVQQTLIFFKLDNDVSCK